MQSSDRREHQLAAPASSRGRGGDTRSTARIILGSFRFEMRGRRSSTLPLIVVTAVVARPVLCKGLTGSFFKPLIAALCARDCGLNSSLAMTVTPAALSDPAA